jgi:hypothetical protein
MTQKNEIGEVWSMWRKNANVTLMWTAEREMRFVEVQRLNGDVIKMDVKPIEWKGLILFRTGTDMAGTGTDVAQDRDKVRGVAYAVRGVRLP